MKGFEVSAVKVPIKSLPTAWAQLTNVTDMLKKNEKQHLYQVNNGCLF